MTQIHVEVITMVEEKFRDWAFRGDIKVKYTDGDGMTQIWQKNQQQLLHEIVAIVNSYLAQNIKLTNRQLYYQLVSAGIIPNADEIYKRICKFLTDGRYAGLVDWDAIEDRGRVPEKHAEWKTIKDLVRSAVYSYRLPRWSDQDHYVELYCFNKGTPVITKNGAVDIENIKIGDEVFTHTNQFRKVINTIKHKHTGIIYEVHPYYLPTLICTENHPFLAIKGKMCVYHNKHCKKTCYRSDICKNAFFRDYTLKWIEASKLDVGDFLVVPKYKKIKDKKSLNIAGVTLNLDADLLRVIGLYVAEGSIECDKRTLKYTFGSHEIKYAKFIRKYFMQKLGVNVSIRKNKKGNTVLVLIFSKNICDYFKIFGIGANNKRLPDEFLELPFEKQKVLIKALMDGDGYYKNEHLTEYSTVSKVLCYQIKTIFDRLNKPSSIFVLKKEKHKLAKYDLYRMSISENKYNYAFFDDNYMYVPIMKIEKKDFNGNVFNITVEKDNSYSVGVISHNCEKQAMESVLKPIADKFHIFFGYNKGYSSASSMYDLAKRLKNKIDDGKTAIVLYLGDHDSSGLDMIRDIRERIEEFLTMGEDYTEPNFKVEQLALNMDQIKAYNPPPNPAKMSDPRAKWYIAKYGRVSWELDALKPDVLIKIAEDGIMRYMDADKYNEWIRLEQEQKKALEDFGKSLAEKEKKKDDDEDDEDDKDDE